MQRWVEITFDCLPLRSLQGVSVPPDASPKLAAKMQRILDAQSHHGTLNTYYLHNASCLFHLTNDPESGLIEFHLEGVVFTDAADEKAIRTELHLQLHRETCDWLNQPIVHWFHETVRRAVLVEFNRFIAAGDLQRTRERLEKLEKSIDAQMGFVGMHL